MSCDPERPLNELGRALAERRHSRRTLLKIGAAAVGATAFPGLFPSVAHATHRDCRTRCVNNPCGFDPFERCGQNDATGDCVCAATTGGKCKCFQPVCLGGPACTRPRECPEGFSCVNDACCGISFCAAKCDTAINGAAASFTRWA